MPREPPVTSATRPARFRWSLEGTSTAGRKLAKRVVMLHQRAARPLTPATRRTALNSAPPLAKLLTSTIGPGASTAVAARAAARGLGERHPKTGDRRHPALRAAEKRRGARRAPRRAELAERALDRRDHAACRRTTPQAPAPRFDRDPASHSPTHRSTFDLAGDRDRRRRSRAASCGPAARRDRATRLSPARRARRRRRRGSRRAAVLRRGRSCSSHRPNPPSPSTNPPRSSSNGAARSRKLRVTATSR